MSLHPVPPAENNNNSSKSKYKALQLYSNFTHCSYCNLPPNAADAHSSPSPSPSPSSTKTKKTLQTCSNCSSSAYHNTTCQKSHWKHHKQYCTRISQCLVPIKELIRWNKLFKRLLLQHNNDDDQQQQQQQQQRLVWCWYHPTTKNGAGGTITHQTLQYTNHTWKNAIEQWYFQNYRDAMSMMQYSLEAYKCAWLSNIRSVGSEENCCLVEKKEEGGGVGENERKIDDNEEGREGVEDSSVSRDGEEQQQQQQQQQEPMDVDNDDIGVECKEERVEDDKEEESAEEEAEEEVEQEFFETSITLAKRLLFLGYCELDGGQISSARQRLVQSISIANTILYSTSRKPHGTNESVQTILNDAYMELMLSMEEEEEVVVGASRHNICNKTTGEVVSNNMMLARHVANMAIMNGNCCGWVHPLQRPGYMANVKPQLSSIPICPVNDRPMWCNELECNYEKILEEYNNLKNLHGGGYGYHQQSSGGISRWLDVGSGHRGSGHNDSRVVSGRGWKEYVLFGTGSLERDDDAPFTKKLLRQHVPDAVTLANDGGGEVIFSRLQPQTHIKPHCGPTNLRWTAHLGLVIPINNKKKSMSESDSAEEDCSSSSPCRIRIGNKWTSWSVGKVLLFDDSFEHEVRNDTNEDRVVLLIRVCHPELMSRGGVGKATQLVAEAIARKEEAVQKRYHPPT